MRAFGFVTGAVKTRPCICQKCLRGLQAKNVRSATRTARAPSALDPDGVHSKRTVAQYATSERLGTGIIYSSHLTSKPTKNKRRRLMILAAILGTASFFALTDSAQHSYAAAERSLRVAYALVRNVRELVYPKCCNYLSQLHS